MKSNYSIDTVLFERDPGEWVAQCLQYDIGAQAESLPELMYEIQKALVGHMVIALESGLEPFECLSPAPEEYWGMWTKATITVEAETVPFRVPAGAPNVVRVLKIAAAA